ncbi:MAG: MarR family transcriptional regulator [Hydrogenophaga sp.]|jgi:DNA-binding MarR family transcriptional regulator|uniref:MarR family winged helix-turn-helix transcriptional regulator n=1 Tax=Hydrogenophaga sp. TaxID=1904254 RepID=UPI002636F5DE|nr:MarR family transcriptional regulator [Hydrogenophaga sp.]MDD3784513.1 MarR family transcriptional regulator [Hydrogenophaga sp.]MDX9967521.1 MarR family transcriptional regulator [Hydrogenophaga sp.]
MNPSEAFDGDIDLLPGYAIRRLQQIAVGIFLQEMAAGGLNLTPVQFGALQVVALQPGIDQRTLAGRIALDTSTIGGVVDRLEARGWLQRRRSTEDRRARLLHLTPAGQQVLAQAVPGMLRAQQLILAPLPPGQRTQFMAMLHTLVTQNNEWSRAPSENPATVGRQGSTIG